MRREVNPPSLPTPAKGYSQVLVIERASAWIFLSGQTAAAVDGTVPHGMRAQAQATWLRVMAGLASVGASAKNICRVTTFVTDRELLAISSAVRDETLHPFRPAVSTVVVSGFARPEYLIEVEVTAYLELDPTSD